MKLAHLIAMTASVAMMTGCMSAPVPTNSTTPWTPPKASQKPDREGVRGQNLDFSKPMALAELADIALQNNPASRAAWSDAWIGRMAQFIVEGITSRFSFRTAKG